jgi:predicted amidophosphoribosyltransferase
MPPTFVVGDRSDLIGKLLYDLKYSSVRALARPIAEILDGILPSILGDVSVVPLPTIAKHKRERGLDHTMLVAKHFARIRGDRYMLDKALERAKNTVQVGANRKKRIAQAASAYIISNKTIIDPSRTYIVYDDVWTTGASIKTAVKLLRGSGAQKIVVVILARAVEKQTAAPSA